VDFPVLLAPDERAAASYKGPVAGGNELVS
jgi:hypothetical protein